MPPITYLLVGSPLVNRSKGRVRLREVPWPPGGGIERWTDSPASEKSLVTKINRVKIGLMEGRQPGEIRNRSLWRMNEFYLGTWNVYL
jgi:hypothetical protein